jgi:hypothetical protein
MKVNYARLLEFDPTPAGLVTRPLSKAYKSVWAKLRKGLLKEHGAVCQVCHHMAEAQRLIHCHEVYSFPNSKVIRLAQVVLLCWRCHDAVHFERTQRWCGQKYSQEIAPHYRTVNGGISEKAFERDLKRGVPPHAGDPQVLWRPGAAPLVDYAPYQQRVDDLTARNAARARQDDDDQADDDGDFEMFPDHEYPSDTAMWRESFAR